MTESDDVGKYVDRLLNDEKFKQLLADSTSSGRKAVRRAKRKGSPGKAVADDRVRHQALAAVTAASDAVAALNRPKKKPKSRWLKRLLVVGLLGVGTYLATDDGARSQLMNAVGIGDEEPLDATG